MLDLYDISTKWNSDAGGIVLTITGERHGTQKRFNATTLFKQPMSMREVTKTLRGLADVLDQADRISSGEPE